MSQPDPELIDLERALYNRAGAEPSALLRDRTLRSVAAALSARPRDSARVGGQWISELSAAAAVLLIGLALSRVAASATSYGPGVEVPATATSAERDATALLRDIVPGLTDPAASGLAWSAAHACSLPPVPVVPPVVRVMQGRRVEPPAFNVGELR